MDRMAGAGNHGVGFCVGSPPKGSTTFQVLPGPACASSAHSLQVENPQGVNLIDESSCTQF